MKPSEALIAVVDDSEFVQKRIPVLAESLGAKVIAHAQTPEEAVALVDDLDTSGVNVVLMDGNLTSGGYQGYMLTDRIREEYPTVHILSISGDKRMGDEFDMPTVKEKGTDLDSLRANIEAL